MLIVEIRVNERTIQVATAVRIKGDTNPKTLNTYRLHDGKIIKHRYGDGAAALVEKMMKYLKGV